MLTGIHLTSYGREKHGEITLLDAIRAVHDIEGIDRIRLGSLDPAAMTEDLIDRLAGLNKLMPHFHISMQSGSDTVLKRMRRRYLSETALKRVNYIREKIPHVLFSTDLIVGFPGETDEEFEETMEFCREAKFYHLHIFPYSKRAGTPAATMSNQVTEDVKDHRLATLSAQQAEIREALARESIASQPQVNVLFEAWDKEYIYGHTENFIEVKAPVDPSLSGEIVPVCLLGYEKGICICKPLV